MAVDSPGPKYEIAPATRQRLRQPVVATNHAAARHRERAPQHAAGISHALEHVSVDECIVGHPFWANRPEDDGGTDAVAAYRGRTSNGKDYGMLYPVVHGPDRPPLAVTAYRVRSVPQQAREWGLSDEVATALRSYLATLGDQGGIIDE
jgi:hypothetical protein